MAEIEPDALDDRVRSTGDVPLVLDIRPADQFESWHIPGSVNVDVYDQLKDAPEDALEALRELPEDREIVTVCAAGKLSAVATEQLRSAGYDARTLRDGLRGWSRVHRTAPVTNDERTLVQVARPATGCLSYVLVSDTEAAVFDPSIHLEEYESVVDEHDAELVGVFDTHAHADHVSGGRRLADRHDVPYHLHPADADDVAVTPLADDQLLEVGSVVIEAAHTPGHSPGSVTYGLDDDVLLTGDTLFHQSVGRVELGIEADIEDASVADNAAALYDGLQRLRRFGDDPLVLPAHDPGTPDPPVRARMSEVEARNPGLGRDREAFVRELAGDVPEHPPNFQRIKRVNVGAEAVAESRLEALEQGPNNCAAE